MSNATMQLRPHWPHIEAYPSFPRREMRDMRNLVVHEYFGVNKLVVWETLQKNLPPILPRLKQLIDSSGK